MRLLLLILLTLIPGLLPVFAACDGDIAHAEVDGIHISINNECEPETQILIWKVNPGRVAAQRTYLFKNECSLTSNGFTCRKGGNTPLAGATYQRTHFGRSQNNCSTDVNELGEKYICVKGCGKKGVPEFLHGNDGSC